MSIGARPADVSSREPFAIVRERECTHVATEPVEVLCGSGKDVLDRLDDGPPGWWAGYIAYEWGHNLERVSDQRIDDDAHPLVTLVRFNRVRPITMAARSIGRRHPVGRMEWASSIDRDGFCERVQSIHRLIGEGVCYQVNLTRRLSVSERLDAMTLFDALEAINPSPRSFLLTLEDLAVGSASPERFLSRAGAHIETSPIKGTSTDEDELLASSKDRAENVMIVDLARNDLGRICAPGSIHVAALCAPERYPGIVHLVSTIAGTLTPGVGTARMVQAMFPAASITGAPKPTVMQTIVDLEPVPRGIYCGAIGWIDTRRQRAALSVAIRTFVVGRHTTSLGVGAGITIESDPSAEWHETELKADNLIRAAGCALAR
jgi:para-aminobenzoate synthetase component I